MQGAPNGYVCEVTADIASIHPSRSDEKRQAAGEIAEDLDPDGLDR